MALTPWTRGGQPRTGTRPLRARHSPPTRSDPPHCRWRLPALERGDLSRRWIYPGGLRTHIIRGLDGLDRARSALGGFRIEAVTDAEMGVDVAPVGGVGLQLLAELPDEDVNGAVAVRHRVAPDALVNLLALDHLAGDLRQELEKLEFATGQPKALATDERLVLVGANLQ